MSKSNMIHTAQNAVPRTRTMAGWLAIRPSNSSELVAGEDQPTAEALHTSLPVEYSRGAGFAAASTGPAHIGQEGHIFAVIVGKPRWLNSELSNIASLEGDATALATAYTQGGEKLTRHLQGEYAFALLDKESGAALLGVDRMGRIPLYYRETPEGVLFGTSTDSIEALDPGTTALSMQGLYHYVYFHMVPSPLPVFAGMKKLPAASIFRLDKQGANVGRHWLPGFSEKALTGRRDSHKVLKCKLKEAVLSALPSAGKVGAFLSGGLDSSTVTGMLAELTGGECDVYSIGFSAEGYDEMAFARITAKHFGARLHEYYVTPDDVVNALPLIASAYDEPFGNSSALPAYFCAKVAAEDGVDLLLAGDGGDELFAGNERYAKQSVFEHYRDLPSPFRGGLLEPLVNAIPGWIPLLGKARSFVAQANTPLPDRLQTYNFLHRHAPQEVFQADFLRAVDTSLPLKLLREVYNLPNPAGTLNRMMYLDWQFTLSDNDLRKVNQTCALAGVEVAYPMLDDDLVEFSLGIPSKWKLPGGKLRHFYKQALLGWLPDATISKPKQGFGLPFGVWMRDHKPLQELAYDNIQTLKSRHLFKTKFLEDAISLHRDGHAAYFGELIWILCILEFWLSARAARFEFPAVYSI